MFVEQLRRAVEASPRCDLPKVSALLWKAFAAGQIAEGEAQALAELIAAKQAIKPTGGQALGAIGQGIARRAGSHPRTPASLERRRRWVASGWLPPQIAARFTPAETAVLAVIATEHARHGRCTLTNDHIAALAGVSRTSVKNALRAARMFGLMRVEERRLSAFRNLSNVVTILSPEWIAWLRMRQRARTPVDDRSPPLARVGQGEGANPRPARIHKDKSEAFAPRNRGWATKGRPDHPPVDARSNARGAPRRC